MTDPIPTVSRRRLLKQTFAFSAAALLGREGRSLAASEASSAGHHFMMIGDWGASDDQRPQQAVANGMKGYMEAQKMKPEALFLVGDNFYGAFKGGVNCPRWKTQFEDMYPKEVFPGPCYAMLGNHDYDDEPKAKLEAELAYAKATPGTRWTLPAKWYAFDFPKKNPLISVIVLDSNYNNRAQSLTPEEREQQMVWFKAQLAKPRTAPWRVVMAHHPLYTNGLHGDNKALITDWDPLFREHKVDFYFAGHDHDLQHIEFEGHPTSFVVSGGGGAKTRALEMPIVSKGPFGQAVYGFSHLQVTEDKFSVRHLDANQKMLHAFTRTRDGKIAIEG
jgi:tartrate-resistant acid phosphatase type 5